MVDIYYGKLVGKYTIVPDPMGNGFTVLPLIL